MPDFWVFLKNFPARQKINKIFLKKFLTFLEYGVIVYGLSKVGRKRKGESNLWIAEIIRNIVNKSSSSKMI